jgi:hypothetical protein
MRVAGGVDFGDRWFISWGWIVEEIFENSKSPFTSQSGKGGGGIILFQLRF